MSIVNLEDLIREVARDADFEAQGRKCHVRCLVDLNVLVSGNPELLHSAIENVVRNATRYTREGSEVEVSLARMDDGPLPQAVIRVLDSGPGVPEGVLKDLFRPFYRLDDARNRQTGGVGLGLAITERAVRLHEQKLRAVCIGSECAFWVAPMLASLARKADSPANSAPPDVCAKSHPHCTM